VVYRLEDHDTVHTHIKLNPPLYQIFPFDFISEVLWPGELHDHHEVPAQQLVAKTPTDVTELRERALEFRDQTLFEAESDASKNGH